VRAKEGRRARHLEVQSSVDGVGAASPEPVGHHDTLEPPLILQHADEEVPVLSAELPAELVVGGHHHADVGLPDSSFEGCEVNLAQRALVDFNVD